MTIGAKQGRSWGGEGEKNATAFGESQTRYRSETEPEPNAYGAKLRIQHNNTWDHFTLPSHAEEFIQKIKKGNNSDHATQQGTSLED